MTTNNSVNSGLSGTTGSGNFVGATSATLVTPTLGAATATTVTFSPTTGGVVGTTTNDNANTGNVGEYVSSTVALGSPVSVTTSTATNITSISLTAGDWDVWGNIGSLPASGTITTNVALWCSTTSASLPASPNNGSYYQNNLVSSAANGQFTIPTGMIRLSLSGTTTVYLSCYISFTVSTMTAYGFIGARRRR